MILYEQGKAYWNIAKAYHSNRHATGIKAVAVRDMAVLQQVNRNPAVGRRIAAFINLHTPRPKPDNPGPRFA